jgi:hypothetical protein
MRVAAQLSMVDMLGLFSSAARHEQRAQLLRQSEAAAAAAPAAAAGNAPVAETLKAANAASEVIPGPTAAPEAAAPAVVAESKQ